MQAAPSPADTTASELLEERLRRLPPQQPQQHGHRRQGANLSENFVHASMTGCLEPVGDTSKEEPS